MGIKKIIKTRKSERELVIYFDVNSGKLFLEIRHVDAQFRNKRIVFTINGDDESIDIDENGKGMIEFEKQIPAIQYNVAIKDKGPIKDAQKLAFWY